MSRGTNQKFKFTYLMKIMLAKTDDEHALTMPQIMEELEKYDVTAERKSIYADFQDMTDKFGIEIIKEQILLSMEWLDEVRGLFHMRRHMACMFKGLPHFRDLRIQMLQAPNIEELWGVFDQIAERYGSMDPNDRMEE